MTSEALENLRVEQGIETVHRCLEYASKNGVRAEWLAEMLEFLGNRRQKQYQETKHLWSSSANYCKECGVLEGHTDDCRLFVIYGYTEGDGWTGKGWPVQVSCITGNRNYRFMLSCHDNGDDILTPPWSLPDLRAHYLHRRRRARRCRVIRR